MEQDATAGTGHTEGPKPWDPSPDDTWIRAVQGWSWLPKPDTDGRVQEWIKQDRCTYCGDTSTVARHAISLTLAYIDIPPDTPIPGPLPIPARCACTSNHPGREHTAFSDGCGKSGWVYYPNP